MLYDEKLTKCLNYQLESLISKEHKIIISYHNNSIRWQTIISGEITVVIIFILMILSSFVLYQLTMKR